MTTFSKPHGWKQAESIFAFYPELEILQKQRDSKLLSFHHPFILETYKAANETFETNLRSLLARYSFPLDVYEDHILFRVEESLRSGHDYYRDRASDKRATPRQANNSRSGYRILGIQLPRDHQNTTQGCLIRPCSKGLYRGLSISKASNRRTWMPTRPITLARGYAMEGAVASGVIVRMAESDSIDERGLGNLRRAQGA
jgi:hypothetical protein